MAWLKIETHTPDKPEVFDISDQLGISSDDAFGKCFRVWCWFDAHTTNGKTNGIGVSDSLIDRVAGVSGFAKAMHSAGWLDWDGECYAMPNFDSHNGESAKQRALTAKRVAKHTEKTNAKTNAPSVTTPLAREEKRREEVNPSVSHEKIVFDGINFQNINGQYEVWKAAYPAVNLEAEMAKAAAWILANPKNKKSNYARFLNSWFSKAQDSAPRVPSAGGIFAGVE